MIPLTRSPFLVRMTTVWAGILLSTNPPSIRIPSTPLSWMVCTIKPHSSVWASSWTTGLHSSTSGILTYKLFMASFSTLYPLQYPAMVRITSSSNPLGPNASEIRPNICIFIINCLLHSDLQKSDSLCSSQDVLQAVASPPISSCPPALTTLQNNVLSPHPSICRPAGGR